MVVGYFAYERRYVADNIAMQTNEQPREARCASRGYSISQLRWLRV